MLTLYTYSTYSINISTINFFRVSDLYFYRLHKKGYNTIFFDVFLKCKRFKRFFYSFKREAGNPITKRLQKKQNNVYKYIV